MINADCKAHAFIKSAPFSKIKTVEIIFSANILSVSLHFAKSKKAARHYQTAITKDIFQLYEKSL